ncbi:hypothetical protein HYS10_02125, partial [Candidatus Collierbacteria bacterium]|nr:hypothetical protein [Candidatus Collierbacteria bacterium]
MKERFDLVFFALTANFSEDEIEILEEMLESGGYSASTYADYVCGAGVIPDPKQLEAESRMEEKQREYLEGLKRQHPKIWEVYQHLLSATEP